MVCVEYNESSKSYRVIFYYNIYSYGRCIKPRDLIGSCFESQLFMYVAKQSTVWGSYLKLAMSIAIVFWFVLQ